MLSLSGQVTATQNGRTVVVRGEENRVTIDVSALSWWTLIKYWWRSRRRRNTSPLRRWISMTGLHVRIIRGGRTLASIHPDAA